MEGKDKCLFFFLTSIVYTLGNQSENRLLPQPNSLGTKTPPGSVNIEKDEHHGLDPRSSISTELSSQCPEVEKFANEFNLCNSSRVTDPSTSCRDICGVELTWEEGSARCSCDERCIVYRDCCTDFHWQCPGVFLKASEKYTYITNSIPLSTHCQYMWLQTVPTTSCPGFYESFTSPSATTSASPTNSRLEDLLQQKSPVVMDVSNDIVFENFQSYQCHRTNESAPFYLPMTFPLSYSDTIESVSHVLSFILHENFAPRTLLSMPGVRGCFTSERVECQVCPDTDEDFKVNEICQDLSLAKPITSRERQNVYNRVMYRSEMKSDSCQHFKSQPSPRNTQLERTERPTVTLQIVSTDMADVVLVFKDTSWRIVWCPNLIVSINECEVVQCCLGCFKSKSGKCFRPRRLEINVQSVSISNRREFLPTPLCTCLRMYRLLQSLNIWFLTEIFLTERQCLFEVQGFHTNFSQEIDYDSLKSIIGMLSVKFKDVNYTVGLFRKYGIDDTEKSRADRNVQKADSMLNGPSEDANDSTASFQSLLPDRFYLYDIDECKNEAGNILVCFKGDGENETECTTVRPNITRSMSNAGNFPGEGNTSYSAGVLIFLLNIASFFPTPVAL